MGEIQHIARVLGDEPIPSLEELGHLKQEYQDQWQQTQDEEAKERWVLTYLMMYMVQQGISIQDYLIEKEWQ